MAKTPAPDLHTVRAFEERSFNAWPARQTVVHRGWIFRLAGGFTKRANSVNALEAGSAFDGVRAAAESLYARHGLPAVFRISPLAVPEADRELDSAGYAFFDPTLVMRGPVDPARADPAVSILGAPTVDWLAGFAAVNQVPLAYRPIHSAMLGAIALPAAFASVRVEGREVAFGLAVLERGAVGCYDIAVDPAWRRRGHGRTLLRALLHWGRGLGAQAGYLQVREGNLAARQLYAGLGFTEFYRYHYRVVHPAG